MVVVNLSIGRSYSEACGGDFDSARVKAHNPRLQCFVLRIQGI